MPASLEPDYVEDSGMRDELTWRMDEIAVAKDRPLAIFYAMLSPFDRNVLSVGHIDVHGDTRNPC